MWRRISKRILKAWQDRRFLKNKSPDKLPLGLSKDQVGSLRQLVGHHSWPTYSRLLESVGESLIREVIQGLPQEKYLAKCGEIQMLERLMELPHVILDKVTELEDHANARQHNDTAAATLVSTPFWRGFIADTPGHNGAD